MSKFFRRATQILEQRPTQLGPQHRGSDLEERTRKQRRFSETEARLPDVKKIVVDDGRPAIVNNVLSYLGSWNPIPIQVTSKNTVWLLDNVAYRNATTGDWEAEFVTAVFDKGTGLEVSTVVADLAEKLGVGRGDAQEERIRDRLIPFMQQILPARVVNVNFAGRELIKCGPGGRNGISSDIKRVQPFKDGDIVDSPAAVPQGADGILEMRTVFAEPEGWAVISGRRLLHTWKTS